jgi:hypothetical protein
MEGMCIPPRGFPAGSVCGEDEIKFFIYYLSALRESITIDSRRALKQYIGQLNAPNFFKIPLIILNECALSIHACRSEITHVLVAAGQFFSDICSLPFCLS